MIFEIEMIKVSTNAIYAGKHFMYRKRLKDSYRWLVFASLKALKLKITTYPVKIKFTFQFSKKSLDASNCSYMGKLIEDALIKEKIIENDSPKFVKAVEYISEKNKKNKIVVEIIEPNL